MRKTLLALAAGLLLAGSLSAASAADKLKVGFIYLGPVGDLGWTYQHELARQALVKELGDKIETTFLENVPEGPDAERSIEQLVRAGNKLIFTTSFGYMDPTLKVAKKYPNVHFEHATGYKRNPNMSTYSAKWYQGRYIQGLIAAKMSKSGVLGYIGSFPIPEVVSGINATILAAQTINPNIKVKIIWANTPLVRSGQGSRRRQGADRPGRRRHHAAHGFAGSDADRQRARQVRLRPGF
ncbi:basic membrane lipoprotein Med (substrate-binding protein (PBP1-ABC) superfamily) [Bradyrhizobium sp. LM2.7]